MHTRQRAAFAALTIAPLTLALLPGASAHAATSASAASASATSVSAQAPAAARNGYCDSGEVCFYYRLRLKGSLSDHGDTLADYGSSAAPSRCYVFKSAGDGQGLCIRNNAASVWNRTTKTIRVYYSPTFRGAYQDIPPKYSANLNASLINNNASHRPA